MANDSTQIDHITKNSFFSYIGVLVGIWITINGAMFGMFFNSLEDVENRFDTRVNKLEERNNQTVEILTDVRISLQRIETRLGIEGDRINNLE